MGEFFLAPSGFWWVLILLGLWQRIFSLCLHLSMAIFSMFPWPLLFLQGHKSLDLGLKKKIQNGFISFYVWKDFFSFFQMRSHEVLVDLDVSGTLLSLQHVIHPSLLSYSELASSQLFSVSQRILRLPLCSSKSLWKSNIYLWQGTVPRYHFLFLWPLKWFEIWSGK